MVPWEVVQWAGEEDRLVRTILKTGRRARTRDKSRVVEGALEDGAAFEDVVELTEAGEDSVEAEEA